MQYRLWHQSHLSEDPIDVTAQQQRFIPVSIPQTAPPPPQHHIFPETSSVFEPYGLNELTVEELDIRVSGRTRIS
jgi:hypothetical protein